MKIYSRIGTWIMIFLLIFGVSSMVLMTKYQPKYYDPNEANVKANWKQTLQEDNQQNKLMVEDPNLPEEHKKYLEENIKINEYRIQNNLSPFTEDGLDTVLLMSEAFIMMITIFTIIVAGGSVAGEFSSGTIKLLLIRPVSRVKILLSKYISTLLFALMLIFLLFISSFALGALFFGFSGLENPILYYADGQVFTRSAIEMTWINFGFGAVQMIMWVTLAFMISSVFRNSALSIGLSIFILFISMPLVQFLMKYSWAKYLIFPNVDLSLYFRGQTPMEGMTLGFSIGVLVVYFLLFHALSFFVFKKRDVGA